MLRYRSAAPKEVVSEESLVLRENASIEQPKMLVNAPITTWCSTKTASDLRLVSGLTVGVLKDPVIAIEGRVEVPGEILTGTDLVRGPIVEALHEEAPAVIGAETNITKAIVGATAMMIDIETADVDKGVNEGSVESLLLYNIESSRIQRFRPQQLL